MKTSTKRFPETPNSKFTTVIKQKTLLFLAFLLFLLPLSIQAGTFPVTNLNDAGAGSLRQAITDVNAAGAGPHDITFTVSGTIVLQSSLPAIASENVTIDGESKIIIDANNTVSVDVSIDVFVSTASNQTYRGFTIMDTGVDVSRFEGDLSNITIEDMVALNSEGNYFNAGIRFAGNFSNIVVRNFTMTQLQAGNVGVYFTGTTDNVVIDNFNLSDTGGGASHGIYFNLGANNITIQNSDIDLFMPNEGDNDGDYAIRFNSTATDITIEQTNVKCDIYGIEFVGVATDIEITDTTFDNSYGTGTSQGIRFSSTLNGLIMTNVFVDMELTEIAGTNDGDYGIVFGADVNFGTSKTATLTNVTVRGADEDGIYINRNIANLTLENCNLLGFGDGASYEDGIQFYNDWEWTNILINNSTFDGNGRAGLLIDTNNAASDFTITNNTFTNSVYTGSGHGIWLYDGDGDRDVTITGNTFANNNGSGVYVDNYPDGIVISENSFYNNGSRGINNNTNANVDLQHIDGDAPVITASTPQGGNSYEVTFTLPAFCTDCDVEFYTNKPNDTPYQGRTYVYTASNLATGLNTVTIDSGGENQGFWTATLMVNTLSYSVSEFSDGFPITPTSPGGEVADLTIWLKADSGTKQSGAAVTLNNNTIDEWINQTSNPVLSFFESEAADDARLLTNTLNFNSVVDIDNNDRLLASGSGVTSADDYLDVDSNTAYIVYTQNSDVTGNNVIFQYRDGHTDDTEQFNLENNPPLFGAPTQSSAAIAATTVTHGEYQILSLIDTDDAGGDTNTISYT